jgi:predicted ATP-binding protein involved in virulence
MYINSLHIDKYKIFEDFKMEFQTPKNNQNIVNIIAGVNGSGKTTLLEWILNIFDEMNHELTGSLIRDDKILLNKSKYYDNIYKYINELKENNRYIDGIHSSPRIIYIPSNMTYNYQTKNMLDITYKFKNIVDTNTILGNAELFIKEYVISKERSSLKSNPKERTKDAIDSFNDIFKDSNLITKLIDLDSFNNNRPIFKTLTKEEITIDKLSSGEQQLYARVVALMILNPHNSVILIDEPEIALHPKWQSQIMDIYANIGKNNQFIVATHSPYIIGSVPNKNINFLIKENNKIVAINNIIAYGRDIEWILEQMGIENSRVSDIAKKIEESQKLLDREKYDEAEKLLDTLETIIGSNDSEILAMRNDIAFWRD